MRKIYAVRDRIAKDLAGQFPLVCFRTDAQALRYFGDSIAIENSALGAHPNDYELIYIGEVKDDGSIDPVEPAIVITGAALVAMAQPKQPQLAKEA